MRAVSVDHYENFPVASVLCPPALRPAVVAIYWFARTADDIADEGDASAEVRLAELAAYRRDLHAMAEAQPVSARWAGVFKALAPVLQRHALPLPLFDDLLSAFAQDTTQTRYHDRAEVLDYCRRSANPVGRLLLHLYGVSNSDALHQSDAICTALQLANFWQDLHMDTRRGRLYLPLSDCARHGVSPEQLMSGTDAPAVRALVADATTWARGLMHQGAPLVHRVPGRAGWELRLVVQGGLRILDKIEALQYDTLRMRPRVGLGDALPMVWRALRMRPPAGAVARVAP